jgi:hypothetical protein
VRSSRDLRGDLRRRAGRGARRRVDGRG